MDTAPLVIGLDFGTDSVRAVIARASDGGTVAASVAAYPRWAEGRYCDPGAHRYRQHPLDGIEAMTAAVRGALDRAPGSAARVRGLSLGATGSTPCLTDAAGTPLALTPGFEDDPDAMFVLWKDHTATAEAARINALAEGTDYLKGAGGIYSSEWLLAKAAHVLGRGGRAADAARGVIEHCDYLPALLTGTLAPDAVRRSRCAAGHKALWSADWNGLPPPEFLGRIHPGLPDVTACYGARTWTTDAAVGTLTPEWAETLGLPRAVTVGVGALDAHVGAVGAQVGPGSLARIIGTSTCDIMVVPEAALGGATVPGICGQVDGSVLPGLTGLEAGQSAFGDLYAWFARLLSAPVLAVLDGQGRGGATDGLDVALIEHLAAQAAGRDPARLTVTALDWINGRRTPDADQTLKAALTGLDMGTDAADVFAAFVEATCFGSRAILDRLRASNVAVDDVIALGGIARKSPFVMQTMADVMGMPIRVSAADEACALGAAMFAAVAADIHPDIASAQAAMGQGWAETYHPDPERRAAYDAKYQDGYVRLAEFVEGGPERRGSGV